MVFVLAPSLFTGQKMRMHCKFPFVLVFSQATEAKYRLANAKPKLRM
jgi:hypothetical protein